MSERLPAGPTAITDRQLEVGRPSVVAQTCSQYSYPFDLDSDASSFWTFSPTTPVL